MKKLSVFLVFVLIIGSFNFFKAPAQANDDGEGIENEPKTMLISELKVGDWVIDTGWEWEHRKGNNYGKEEGDEEKPVVWIVAARDHYSGIGTHVTLVSEEVIGKHRFDSSSSHWNESELRNDFLNDMFYNAFSNDFKRGVARTVLPNKDKDGNYYNTNDRVFIPSMNEYGREHKNTLNDIGENFSYFEDNPIQIANVDFIWTRSPSSGNRLMIVTREGHPLAVESRFSPNQHHIGIRPALNLRGDVVVSAEPCGDTGAYVIVEVPYLPGDVNGDGEVTVTDAIMVLRHIVGLITLEDDERDRADVNMDDNVAVQDAIMILRIVVGLA